jgi:hypothetical protein
MKPFSKRIELMSGAGDERLLFVGRSPSANSKEGGYNYADGAGKSRPVVSYNSHGHVKWVRPSGGGGKVGFTQPTYNLSPEVVSRMYNAVSAAAGEAVQRGKIERKKTPTYGVQRPSSASAGSFVVYKYMCAYI